MKYLKFKDEQKEYFINDDSILFNKIYECDHEDENFYKIINEYGFKVSYYKHRFKDITRNIKIMKLI